MLLALHLADVIAASHAGENSLLLQPVTCVSCAPQLRAAWNKLSLQAQDFSLGSLAMPNFAGVEKGAFVLQWRMFQRDHL